MTAQPTRQLVAAGTKPTFAAATVSDTVEVGNGLNTFAVYKNTDGSPSTVTVVVPGVNSYGSANPDPVYTVASTSGEVWIPLRKEYGDPSLGGRATITASSVTALTVAVVRVG